MGMTLTQTLRGILPWLKPAAKKSAGDGARDHYLNVRSRIMLGGIEFTPSICELIEEGDRTVDLLRLAEITRILEPYAEEADQLFFSIW